MCYRIQVLHASTILNETSSGTYTNMLIVISNITCLMVYSDKYDSNEDEEEKEDMAEHVHEEERVGEKEPHI